LRNSSYLAVATVLFLFSTHASAVELGKVDVASHLGESFYAEVPLTLDEGEVISTVSVELASPAGYKTLKVHRDPALSMIRADVEMDARGSRIKLSSRSPIDAPFVIILLKVRHGHATHYKKYPVFLDVSHAAQPLKTKAPLPTISIEDVKENSTVAATSSVTSLRIESSGTEEKVTDEASPAFRPFDKWARTSHYGPIVYGDSIYTISDRLRIDKRYTIKQIMVALFEKNRTRFVEDNLNLPLHGTYLDVPMAEEVELNSYDQALSIIQDHARRWKELVKQPRYAAIAEAQRTRYSKRARVAEDIKAPRESSAWVEGRHSEKGP